MNILFVTEDLHSEHLTIMSFSSMLKKFGYGVDITEARYDSVRTKLQKRDFSLLVFALRYSGVARHYLGLNLKIKKELNILSVFSGLYMKFNPEIINEEGVDAVCITEGDYALLDLVNNLSAGKSITELKGWWIKKNGQIFRNPALPVIKDLDSLPFADRTLFHNNPVLHMLSTRGCPYRCSFCMYGDEYRCRSVDNVIEELRQAKAQTRAKFVIFEDPTFNFDLSWLKEFSQKYKKTIGLPFSCSVHADLVTAENIKYLKEAGCFTVTFGIESGSEYVRNQILKKGLTNMQIFSAANIIRKYKIRLRTTNIVGIPFGSLDDDLETLKLNTQCRPDFTTTRKFLIHKNTDIYTSLVGQLNLEKLNDYCGGGFYVDLESKNCYRKILKIKNLEQLFNLVVGFPFLLPFVPFLIKLPFHKFYLFLNILWSEYCLCFRMGGKHTMSLRWLVYSMKRLTNERPQEIFRRMTEHLSFISRI